MQAGSGTEWRAARAPSDGPQGTQAAPEAERPAPRRSRARAAPSTTADPAVTREAVAWAIRLFLGREPTDEREIALHSGHGSLDGLRRAFAESTEFRRFYQTVQGEKARWGLPMFMLTAPAEPVRYLFEPPVLAYPVTQLCTAAQCREPAFVEISMAMALHRTLHRKGWEACYVVAALATQGMVGFGRRAMGFGCGRERIPSLLASRGVEVLATDAPEHLLPAEQRSVMQRRIGTRLADLFHPQIIHLDDFERLVGFEEVDMTHIPTDLDGQFDCCWSTSAMQHLGSIDLGLDFVEESLRVLRPGGIAVHTTDFNASSDTDTLETFEHVVFRRRDLLDLFQRLTEEGHEVMPFNLHPGMDPEDELIDQPPYGLPHLKVKLEGHIVTSVGMMVRKRG